jgi:hypothetical protein
MILTDESADLGEVAMWIDFLMAALAPTEVAQVIEKDSAVIDAPVHQLGRCVVIRGELGDSETLLPGTSALGYATDFSNGQLHFDPYHLSEKPEIIIVQEPKHGTLSPVYDDYKYTVDTAHDFVGNDYVVFDVKFCDDVIRINYVLSVDVGQPSYSFNEKGEKIRDPNRCPQETWKISQARVDAA